jgi:hypothetical protein
MQGPTRAEVLALLALLVYKGANTELKRQSAGDRGKTGQRGRARGEKGGARSGGGARRGGGGRGWADSEVLNLLALLVQKYKYSKARHRGGTKRRRGAGRGAQFTALLVQKAEVLKLLLY